MPVITLILRGFGLSMGLIVAIGAQNAYVLRQGIRREHVLATALTCSLSDAVMFTIGAAGFGTLINQAPALTHITAWGGAAFLFYYGATAFRSAWKPGAMDIRANPQPAGRSLWGTVLGALAVSVLNPHAWLDTVVLVGGIAGQYPPGERVFFTAGAMLASLTWFLSLAYGAGFLAPVFARPSAWRVLDSAVGLIMWGIALSLILGEIRA